MGEYGPVPPDRGVPETFAILDVRLFLESLNACDLVGILGHSSQMRDTNANTVQLLRLTRRQLDDN